MNDFDIAEYNARVKRAYMQDESVKKMIRSSLYKPVILALRARDKADEHRTELEVFVFETVVGALSIDDISEKMTRLERTKKAAKICSHLTAARNEISDLVGISRYDTPYAFHAEFQWLSEELVESVLDHVSGFGFDINQDAMALLELSMHHIFLDKTPRILQSMKDAVESWGKSETTLKHPNDANAPRLYFIRKMTAAFNSRFGSPMRSATLSLASIFFDCSDMTEATLSRIAPVKR